MTLRSLARTQAICQRLEADAEQYRAQKAQVDVAAQLKTIADYREFRVGPLFNPVAPLRVGLFCSWL